MEQDRRRTWEERHRDASAVPTPSAFVVRALDHLATASPGITGRALDVACGRGRHALLLAERGFLVDAVDYARPALVMLRSEARARRLRVHCLAADVTTWPLPAGRYALVVVVSFHERALVPALRTAVAPGGVLLYDTFHRSGGSDAATPGMRAEFLLAPGELDAICRGWEVLLRHDDTTTHDGRTVRRAGILARRPHDPASLATAH